MKGVKHLDFGLVGAGSMGQEHLKTIESIPEINLVGICDRDSRRATETAKRYRTAAFDSVEGLLNNRSLDALLIATPHYDHTKIVLEAFGRENAPHVLTEKPVGVHVNDIERMISSYSVARTKNPKLRFAAMFQLRAQAPWRKMKDLVDTGELGRLTRMTWIVTDWFRTQRYYDTGGWRGTWKGEGGGVLLNQCPHNLDMFQWIGGMPDSVIGYAGIGKYHQIEVEDEVSAIFLYENGMIGHFITTTAESPGTNRLEIAGEMGKLVYENDRISFIRNRCSMLEILKHSENRFDKVENWYCNVPFDTSNESGHKTVIENFCASILHGEELIAPAEEGLYSVSMSNAIMLSQARGGIPVAIPVDGDAYEKWLNERIETSDFQKNNTVEPVPNDSFSNSY